MNTSLSKILAPKGPPRVRRRRNWAFLASLRERGMRQEDIAERIGSSRAHVCQVLAGGPGRGHRTRKKIAALLTVRELAMLGWTAQGELVQDNDSLFHGECSKHEIQ